MRPKFGNSSISMREVIITSILQRFDLKNQFFEVCYWFKFNNLELALGMALKFYTSVAKGLKLKVREFCCGANSYICRSYRGKTSRVAGFLAPILNRVKGGFILTSL